MPIAPRPIYQADLTDAQILAFAAALRHQNVLRLAARSLRLRLVVSDGGHFWRFCRGDIILVCYIPALEIWSIPQESAEGRVAVEDLPGLLEAAVLDLGYA